MISRVGNFLFDEYSIACLDIKNEMKDEIITKYETKTRRNRKYQRQHESGSFSELPILQAISRGPAWIRLTIAAPPGFPRFL